MKKFFLFFLVIFVLFPKSESFAEFSDVEKGSWYEEAVIALYKRNIISGYSDGTFRPANQVNRVEFIKILINTFRVRGKYVFSQTKLCTSVWMWSFPLAWKTDYMKR
jgi:hypothetical protein